MNQSKRGKNEQIIDGCKKLQATQKPGQSFSVSEIGRACGVHCRSIVFIERRALHNFTKRLHSMAPNLFAEILRDRPIHEIFDNLSGDPYRTGKPAVRVKLARKKKITMQPAGLMPITEITARLRDGTGNWNRRDSFLVGGRWFSEGVKKGHKLREVDVAEERLAKYGMLEPLKAHELAHVGSTERLRLAV